jgi:hypothetical protein
MSIFILSCSSTQNVKQEVKCPKIYKNKYTAVLNEKYLVINSNDTTSYNEIRFECVYSALYTHKVMYDLYGKWNKEIYPSNRKHPILMWEKIDLFSNGKEYTILTNGLEERKHIYASVMVFDDTETDLLSEISVEREAITNLFTDFFENKNNKKKDFYEVYWNMIDPNKEKQ